MNHLAYSKKILFCEVASYLPLFAIVFYGQYYTHMDLSKFYRVSDKLLQTDTVYLARGTFWLNIGSGIGIAIAFLLSVAYARYIPKEAYGNYRYILSLMGMAGIFALPGMSTIITRAAARGFDGTFRKASRIIFYSSFGISAISILIAIIFAIQKKPILALSFIIAAIAVPFVEGLGNWRGYLDGKKEFRKKTILNGFAKIFYGFGMLTAIGIIIFFKLSILPTTLLLITIFYLTQSLTNLFISRSILQKIPKNAPEEPAAIRYGLHLSIATIPSTIANYADSVILYPILGPSSVALYSFAIAIPEQFKVLFINVATAIFPKLSVRQYNSESTQSDKKLILKKLRKLIG